MKEEQTLGSSVSGGNDEVGERAELIALRAELQCLEREMWENKVRRADLTTRLEERDQWIAEVRNSPAWKIMKPFWKLQRHFSKGRSGACQQKKCGQLVFALDPPDTSAAEGVLKLRGWCFAHGGPETVGVRAKIGTKSVFARYGLKRHDLARTAVEYPAALHSGFSLSIPIAPGSSSFRLEAITQGGSWECFLEQPIHQAANGHASGNDNTPRLKMVDLSASYQESLTLYPAVTAAEVPSAIGTLLNQLPPAIPARVPLFSIITPVSSISPRWIAEAGASLLKQSFTHWEWCLIVQGRHESESAQMLEQVAATHSRFRLIRTDTGKTSAAINLGLDAANGENVCFLKPQDILHRDALALMADKLKQGFEVVYADEDKFDESSGQLIEPFFKPEWSPEYLRGAMYVGQFLAVRRLLAATIRFDASFEGVEAFEFMLRVSESGARIGHVAQALYHSRKRPKRILSRTRTRSRISLLQQRAVNEHLRRVNLPARAELAAIAQRLRIVPFARRSYPKISIIIPTKDSPDLLSRCLNSLYENTSYPVFETILIDNDTSDPQALALMRTYPITRLYLPNPFNFSRANNLAARHATGEYLVFLNNDTEVVSARWLDNLLYYAEQEDVGAAGALLLHDNGAVQHGGVVLGMRGTADHAMRGFSAKSDGYLGSLTCAREVSAVTAACMMMRRALFGKLGGFNEHFFTIYQDLDLCLRLRQHGLRIIWTPRSVLLHHESISRQRYYDTTDRYLLLDRWQDAIEQGDPYYNPNLNLERGDYSNR